MNKLFSLTALAFVCCIALATANMYQMYMPQKGMMYGGGYGGYGYGGGGGAGFNPVGQGGIMQFFFMIIFLMFFMEIFQSFGDDNKNNKY